MQLAFAAVGAGVGSMFGMASLGWSIGGMIGGMFEKGPTIEGPRLNDLKVMNSAYGMGIPRTWGTVRIAGNIIWAADLIETRSEQKQGGKGGPPKATVVSYTYDADFAYALCDNEIEGIRRLWFNNELVYNAGASTATTIIASNLAASNIKVYTGTEDQLPDPVIESYVGVGNTPAYRGVSYIRFNRLALEKWNNQIPNIEAEVVQTGTAADFRALGNLPIEQPVNGYSNPPYTLENGFGGLYYQIGESGGFYGINYGGIYIAGVEGNAVRIFCGDVLDKQDVISNGMGGFMLTGNKKRQDWANNAYSYLIDIETGEVLERTPAANVINGGFSGIFEFTPYPEGTNAPSYSMPTAGIWVGGSNPLVPFRYVYLLAGGCDVINGFTDPVSGTYFPDNMIRALPPFGVGPGISVLGTLAGLGYAGKICYGFTMSADNRRMYCFISDNTGLDIFNKPIPSDPHTIVELEIGDNDDAVLVRTLTFNGGLSTQSLRDEFGFKGATSFYTSSHGRMESDYTNFWLKTSAGKMVLLKVNESNELTYVDEISINAGNPVDYTADANFFSVFADGGVCIGVSDKSIYKFTRNASLSTLPIKLYEIVDDLCAISNLDPSEWDSSELLDDVYGYVLANQTTARAAIEPLQAAFFFDAVESDGKLKFRKRGRAVSVNIPEDDLAAMENMNTDLPDQVVRTRTQEMELPKEVAINYFSFEADYQQNTQTAARQIVRSVNKLTVDLPIVMPNDKAKQVSDVNLYSAWEQRETYTFSTNRKYMLLDPTDVVVINKGGNQFKLRIVSRSDGGNGIVSFEGVREDIDAYLQYTKGAGMSKGLQDVYLPTPTRLKVIDTVSLRDGDSSGPITYLAATGFGNRWDGGLLFKSTDNGQNFSETGVVFKNRSVIGTVDLAFSAPDQFGIFDEETQIVVNLASEDDTLSSVSEAQVLAGSNACYIGGEIIQFKNAVQVDTRQWRLSGLLRGRLGTEKYAYTHTGGEDFILLDSSRLNAFGMEVGNIGQDIQFKAPSFGQTVNQAGSVNITYQGNNMRPLAPVYVRGIQEANGDWKIDWIRRSRTGKAWINGVDAPLGEDKEEYLIEIYDANFASKKSQYTATSQSLTYSQAQQITDFGAAQTRFGVKVFQVNSTIGAGEGAQQLIQVGAGRISDANAALIDTLLLLKPHSLFTFQELSGTTAYIKTRSPAFNGTYFGSPGLNKYENERKSVDFSVGTNDYAGMPAPTIDFSTGTTVIKAQKPTSVQNAEEFFTMGGTVGGTVDALRIQRNAATNQYAVFSHNNTTVSSIIENTTSSLTLNDYKIVSFTIAAGTAATLANAFLYVNNVQLTTTGTQLFVPRNVTRNAFYVNRTQTGGVYSNTIDCGTAVFRRPLSAIERQQIQNAFDFGAWPTVYRARLSNFIGSDLLGRSIEAVAGVTQDLTEASGACLSFDGSVGSGIFYTPSSIFDYASNNFSVAFDFKTGSDITTFQTLFDLGSNTTNVSATNNCSRVDGLVIHIEGGVLRVGSTYASGATVIALSVIQSGLALQPNRWYRLVLKKTTTGIPSGVTNTTANTVIYSLETPLTELRVGNATAYSGTGGAQHLAIGNLNQTAGINAPFLGKIRDVRYIVGDFFADAQ